MSWQDARPDRTKGRLSGQPDDFVHLADMVGGLTDTDGTGLSEPRHPRFLSVGPFLTGTTMVGWVPRHTDGKPLGRGAGRVASQVGRSDQGRASRQPGEALSDGRCRLLAPSGG